MDLLESINRIIRLGEIEIPNKEDLVEILERDLINVYLLVLSEKTEFNDMDYPNPPEWNRKEIRKMVALNFPNFGFYNTVLVLKEKIMDEKNIGVGDAIDDLEDIIYDLMDVRWKLQNTSVNDALRDLLESFRIHWNYHIINLLKYIRD